MIDDLLHFFRERNKPNLTLVVVKFYNGLGNVHYRWTFESCKCICTPAKILAYVLLALVRFVGTSRRIHRTVPLFANTFELFHPKTNPSRNRTRCKKLTNLYECLRLSFNGHKCLSRDVMGSYAKVPTNYSLECLQGISDNIPTLASHGMKFIESIEFEGLFNKWS